VKILINASTVKIAGGLTIALNFLKAYKFSNFKHKLHVIAPVGCGYNTYISENISLSEIPNEILRKSKRLYLNNTWISNEIEEFKPDFIFTLGNVPLKTNLPQAHLLSNPFVVEKNYKKLNLDNKQNRNQKIRKLLFKQNLKYVDIIFPQTEIIKSKLENLYSPSAKIIVVPMAYSKLDNHFTNYKLLFEKYEDKIKLLCLSRYYQHKNIEILLNLAQIIKKQKSPYIIVTTVDKLHNKKAEKFIDDISKMKLEDVLINIGEVRYQNIEQLYNKTDALLLPTLLESFSSTYVDAMYFKKPIFTSNLDFAKEVCGDAGFYFNPIKAESIFKTVKEAFDNPKIIEDKISKGIDRIKFLPDWNDTMNIYISEIEKYISERLC